MKTFALIAMATLAFAGTPARAATNLVANGSFEQGTANIGSFQGWQTALGDASTFVDSSGQTGTHYGQASDGVWSAYFGSTAASGGSTISQTLATTAGQAYVLTFDIANDNAGVAASNAFRINWNGSIARSFSNLASGGYTTFSTILIATGASSVLGIFGFNDSGYLEIDKVSLSVSAVPEPATSMLVMTGLLTIGSLTTRSRRR